MAFGGAFVARLAFWATIVETCCQLVSRHVVGLLLWLFSSFQLLLLVSGERVYWVSLFCRGSSVA